jgi:hypothetical protein
MEEIQTERNYSSLEYWIKYFRTYVLYLRNKPIRNRKDLPFLLCILNLRGEGAEIGVSWGAFSKILFDNSKLSKLHLIDPWISQDKEIYNDVINVDQEGFDERHQFVTKLFKDEGKRCRTLRMTSEEAAKEIEDNSLDFVYIDANHSYEATSQDISLWWPKVKKGGVFSGHDYTNGGPYNFGVKRAVDEFISGNGEKVFIIKHVAPSWYIIKNT